MLNIVTFTPMPSAITATTTAVKPGVRRSERSAKRRSWIRVSMVASASALAALVDDAAVEQVDRALGVAGEARVVGDHADRRAHPVQVLQQLHHRVAVRGV